MNILLHLLYHKSIYLSPYHSISSYICMMMHFKQVEDIHIDCYANQNFKTHSLLATSPFLFLAHSGLLLKYRACLHLAQKGGMA